MKVKGNHRSKFFNLSNWKEEAWEIPGFQRDKALIFFRLRPSNCLSWKIYCNDHSLFSSTVKLNKLQPVQPSPEPRLIYQSVEFVKQNSIIDGIKDLTKSKENTKGMFIAIKSKEAFFI